MQGLNTIVTTVGKSKNTTVTTVTTVGDKYKTTEALFEDLSDLVNQEFKAWYCKQFHVLGAAEVLKRASIARNDAKGDKRHYFSYLLKHYRASGAVVV
jgi:ribulose kinase